MLNTSMFQLTVWVLRSSVTVAFANAPVSTPGAGVSFAPDNTATNRTMLDWAWAVPASPLMNSTAAAVNSTRRISDSFSPITLVFRSTRVPPTTLSTPKTSHTRNGAESAKQEARHAPATRALVRHALETACGVFVADRNGSIRVTAGENPYAHRKGIDEL